MKRSIGPIFAASLLAFVCVAADAPPGKIPAPGRMRLTFDERSPLTTPEEILRRTEQFRGRPIVPHDWGTADIERVTYDVKDYEFDVIVPPRYTAKAPHGLFIWIGQCDIQNIWLPVLARHKLIAAVPLDPRIPVDPKIAHVSKVPPGVRIGLAVDAVHNLAKRCEIDPQRIYISGFSAGGDLAADIHRGYSDVFSGGYHVMGGDYYVCRLSADGKSAELSNTVSGPAWHDPIDEMKRDAKIVIMRAQRDRSRPAPEGKAGVECLRLDGFTRATYLEVPDWPHRPPPGPWFEKAIVALDAKPTTKRPTTAPTKDPNPSPDQLAQARRLIADADFRLWQIGKIEANGQKSILKFIARETEVAAQSLEQVLKDFPTTPSADRAREMLKELKRPATDASQ